MAATKNLSLVVLAGAVGYLIYRRSLTAQETAFATIAAPVPSPGTAGLGAMPRARLSSRGGTNMLAGLPGVWVPEESGWDKPVVSGLGDLGRGFHRPSFSSIKSVATDIAISAIPIVGPSLAIQRVAKKATFLPARVQKVLVAGTTMAIPVVGAAMATQKLVTSRGESLIPASDLDLIRRFQKHDPMSTMLGTRKYFQRKPTGQPEAVPTAVTNADGTTDQTIVYQDANGNVITQDQYNQLMAQQAQTQQVQSPALNAQSASVTNATPISYSDSGTLYTSQGATNIAPTATATDSGGGASGGAEPTGRFDGQASGGTDVSTPNADTQNTPASGGKMALFLAAAGAGAFFLLKK